MHTRTCSLSTEPQGKDSEGLFQIPFNNFLLRIRQSKEPLCWKREKDRKNIFPSSVKWFHYRFFIIVSISGTSFEIIRTKSGITSLFYFINVSLINWNFNCCNIGLIKLDEWTKLAFESEHDSVQTRNRRDLKFGSKGEFQRGVNHW